jgi:hypothetical protein
MSAYNHAALVVPSVSLAIGGEANSSTIITHGVGRFAVRVLAYVQATGQPFLSFEVSQPSVNQVVVGNLSSEAVDLRIMVVFEELSTWEADVGVPDSRITFGVSSGIDPVGGGVSFDPVGNTPNEDGASVAGGNVITLQPADADNPGVVTTGAQTLAGDKTMPGIIDQYAQKRRIVEDSSYTLVDEDSGTIVILSDATGVDLFVPEGLKEGFNCTIEQGDAGQVTVIGLDAVVINNRQSHTKTAGQHAAVAIYNSVGVDVYTLAGDTAA